MWGFSFNGLKKTPVFDFFCQMSKWAGAFSTSVHWSLDCVFLPSLVLGYNFMLIVVLMMTGFFPLVRAKLFTGKIGSQEISNFIPPWREVWPKYCCHPYILLWFRLLGCPTFLQSGLRVLATTNKHTEENKRNWIITRASRTTVVKGRNLFARTSKLQKTQDHIKRNRLSKK